MATGRRNTRPTRGLSPFEETAKTLLTALWAEVEDIDLVDLPVGDISEGAYQVFEHHEIGWKYSILIQTAGKAADFSLDALCLQKRDGQASMWEPREFAKRVIVPWNAVIGAPLGTSLDPYVNNIFRSPRFNDGMRNGRRSTNMFDAVKSILDHVERSTTPAEVHDKLKLMLAQLRLYMNGKTFEYPVPQRIGLADTLGCVTEYLSRSSGGTRLQAVAHGLVMALRSIGIPYETISARHVNAADAATQSGGDVECFVGNTSALTIEVKDRVLTIPELEGSIEKARLANVKELLFFIHRRSGEATAEGDKQRIEEIVASEFALGLNIYIERATEFLRLSCVLLGEPGRKIFLQHVGEALGMQGADPKHRWAWSQAVRKIGQIGQSGS